MRFVAVYIAVDLGTARNPAAIRAGPENRSRLPRVPSLQEDDREVRRDGTDPPVRALATLAPRRLREADAAGRTALQRGAVCERGRQLVRQRRLVQVPGTITQTPERGTHPSPSVGVAQRSSRRGLACPL